MFPENFRSARNKVKKQRETLVIALRNRRYKKWLNIRRKESDFQFSVRDLKEQVKGTSFENVTCDVREERKQKKKC